MGFFIRFIRNFGYLWMNLIMTSHRFPSLQWRDFFYSGGFPNSLAAMIRAIFHNKSARELEKANLDGHIKVTSLCVYIYIYTVCIYIFRIIVMVKGFTRMYIPDTFDSKWVILSIYPWCEDLCASCWPWIVPEGGSFPASLKNPKGHSNGHILEVPSCEILFIMILWQIVVFQHSSWKIWAPVVKQRMRSSIATARPYHAEHLSPAILPTGPHHVSDATRSHRVVHALGPHFHTLEQGGPRLMWPERYGSDMIVAYSS